MNGLNSQVQYSRISTQEVSSLSNDEESNIEEDMTESEIDKRIPTKKSNDNDDLSESAAPPLGSIVRSHSLVIGNDSPNPFSRRPSKARDFTYAAIFILHFVLVSVLTGTEDLELQESFTKWSWTVMIVTMLGSCLGIAAVFLISDETYREPVLSYGVPLAITSSICFGNILILTKSRFSLVGLIILGIALKDTFSIKSARENLSFTIALLNMAIDVCKPYGTSLTVTCSCILILQTAVLMWWGILFVGLITKQPSEISQLLVGKI